MSASRLRPSAQMQLVAGAGNAAHGAVVGEGERLGPCKPRGSGDAPDADAGAGGGTSPEKAVMGGMGPRERVLGSLNDGRSRLRGRSAKACIQGG